jgi:hypothetical protein
LPMGSLYNLTRLPILLVPKGFGLLPPVLSGAGLTTTSSNY